MFCFFHLKWDGAIHLRSIDSGETNTLLSRNVETEVDFYEECVAVNPVQNFCLVFVHRKMVTYLKRKKISENFHNHSIILFLNLPIYSQKSKFTPILWLRSQTIWAIVQIVPYIRGKWYLYLLFYYENSKSPKTTAKIFDENHIKKKEKIKSFVFPEKICTLFLKYEMLIFTFPKYEWQNLHSFFWQSRSPCHLGWCPEQMVVFCSGYYCGSDRSGWLYESPKLLEIPQSEIEKRKQSGGE